MKKFVLISTLLTFLVTLSFGGSENGNGAWAVVIYEGPRLVRIALTDLWEAAVPHFSPRLPGNQNKYNLAVPDQNESWKEFYAKRKELFQTKATEAGPLGSEFLHLFEQAEKMLSTYPRLSGEGCPRSSDVLNRTLPPTFNVIQAIYTYINPTNHRDGFMCVSSLFETHADKANRAAAEFHEPALLAAKTAFGHIHSDPSRRLVALVFSEGFASLPGAEFERFLTWYFKPSSQIQAARKGRVPVSQSLGSTNPILSLVLDQPTLQPESLLSRFYKKSPNNFSSAYSFAGRRPLTQEEMSRIKPIKYRCDHRFELRKETYDGRGLGQESQLFVVPPEQSGYRFSPGARWFPHGNENSFETNSAMAALRRESRFAGPFPFAVFSFSSADEPYVDSEIYQTVVIRDDLEVIHWSFGGLAGTCR